MRFAILIGFDKHIIKLLSDHSYIPCLALMAFEGDVSIAAFVLYKNSV